MLLSILIVNYNAKYFLEQCLCSVDRALDGLDAETIVVDNQSTDDCLAYLRPMFPRVQFHTNAENLGFAKANNQGLPLARGENILFLNPDTLVTKEVIIACLEFLQYNAHAGAIGLRMVDGQGHYLPESKRGFPFPSSAFFKLFGVAAMFPKSKTFASYYLGHLPEKEINKVDVVSGAFMMLRREVLEKTGGFDESFFMYGEDIDLSYRIQQAGYSNYYLGSQTILHFKGESTPKDLVHLHLFYKAMELFIDKWFRHKSSSIGFYSLLLAIRIRKALAGMNRRIHSPGLPAVNRFFLEGDPLSISEIRSGLELAGKTIVKNAREADRIVFCEGGEYSYHEIIGQIQMRNHQGSFGFHGRQTRSIVGSPSKHNMGEIFLI